MASIRLMPSVMLDNNGRRSGADRRAFSYAAHLPERRMVQERRTRVDRRRTARFGLRTPLAVTEKMALSY